MDNYKEMYLHLFNEVTNVIEILKKAQIDCEEMFMENKNNNDENKKTNNNL